MSRKPFLLIYSYFLARPAQSGFQQGPENIVSIIQRNETNRTKPVTRNHFAAPSARLPCKNLKNR